MYHLHDPELLLTALLLAWTTDASVIFDVHELEEDLWNRSWLPRWGRFAVRVGYRTVRRIAERFLTFILAEDSYQRIYCRKWPVIHNFARLQPKRIAPPSLVSPPVLIYVGAVTERRGALTMVEALGRLRHQTAMLRILGPCDEPGLVDAMRFRARELGVEHRLELRPQRMPYPDALAAMNEATLGLALLAPISNYVDSYPSKLFDYMACGLPAVVAHFPLWSSVVSRGTGLSVDPTDHCAAAAGIDELLRDPRRLDAMGQRGRALMEQEYSWDREGERLVALYREIVKA